MTMKAIPYVFKAFAIDAPHAQVRFLKDRKAMMSRGCPEVYPLKIYRHQVLNGLIKLPWAVKPMIGLTSDVLPVMGFRKASESNLHSVLVEFVSRCIGLDNVEADLKPNMNCLFWHECRDHIWRSLLSVGFAPLHLSSPALRPLSSPLGNPNYRNLPSMLTWSLKQGGEGNVYCTFLWTRNSVTLFEILSKIWLNMGQWDRGFNEICFLQFCVCA